MPQVWISGTEERGARMQGHSGRVRAAGYPGVQAGAAAAAHEEWRVALETVARQVLAGRDTAPDVIVLFASSAWADDYPDLVREACTRTGARCLVGSSARGVLAGVANFESEPSLAMLALWLPGVTLTPVRLHQSMLDQLDYPGELASLPAPTDTNGWLVLADPYRMDAQDALMRLRARYPAVPMVGALASTLATDRKSWVFFDEHVYDEGGVALAIGGDYALEVVVSQGAVPIGEPWTITGVDRNRITSISNRRATEVMEETLAAFPPRIREEMRRNLMVGFPMDEYQDGFERGEFVIRGLLGVDDDAGAVIVGSLPRIGQTVQFHLRDAVNASLDVHQVLGELAITHQGDEVVAGIMATCKGRGQAMFGRPDHDAAAVRDAFGDLPVAGMFSFGEIGPVCGIPALNSFAMALGLIVHKR